MDGRSKGGVENGKRLRSRAVARYYEDPNVCENCGSVIRVGDGDRVYDVRKKRFCNRSCAASFNNRKHPKRLARETCVCEDCGDVVVLKPQRGGGYVQRRFCDTCAKARRIGGKPIGLRTKGEVFSGSKNWISARSSIRKDAWRVFEGSGAERVCEVCGYSLHVDVCHIKPVSDFGDSALVSEVNDILNLIALCPNHHWEYDNGHLDLMRDRQ